MKVKFTGPGQNLSAGMLQLGYSSRANFNLTAGEVSTVYGISIWRNVVHYLIFLLAESIPSWFPADIFEIVDESMPHQWSFRYFGDLNPNELKLIIGYKELLDVEYYVDLINLENDSKQIFLARKKEIDEETKM